jgi:peptidoglycan/LPS O-acetylase OafA/YrhL
MASPTTPIVEPTADSTAGQPRPATTLPRPPLTHRPDIDGLRAVAILLVVAYHARVPGFEGGFIGVDVFFVLSGFLITRLITAEADRTGSVHLGRFWLRRFRRLFPAAATMIGSVLLASLVIDSPLEWRDRAESAFAALTYWSNHLFAREVGSYFSPAVETDPFLHTWSLAVEEQFYVLWPLLFFLLGLCVDSRLPGGRRVRIGATAGFVAASLMLSLRLTAAGSSLAFYSALSRAWEFGAGALLAMVTVSLSASGTELSAGTRRRLTAMGAIVLVVAIVVIDDGTRYPGAAALLPVIATLTLLTAEPERGIVGRSLRSGPARTIGLVSYSWYLWHWPVIVLGTTQLGSDSAATRTLLAGAALLPAAVTYHVIENPIRRSRRLARSAPATLLVIGGFTVATVAVTGLVLVRADRIDEDPFLADLVAARADLTEFDGACTLLDADVLRTRCSAGPLDEGPTVVLLGDSHAAHWLPSVDAAVADLGGGRVASVRVSCPSIAFAWASAEPECVERQGRVPDLVAELDPDLVVMRHSVGYVDDDAEARAAWRASLTDFAGMLAALEVDLLVVLDVPRFPADPLSCAARHGDPSPCALDLALDRCEVEHRLGPQHEAERAALAEAGHGVTLDPIPLLCGLDRCPVMIDGAVAYADEHHLAGEFAASLGPELAAAMARAGVPTGL